jgi:hypothetical protein
MLRRLVRSRLGVPVADDFFGDPILDDSINLAIQVVEGEYHWPWSDALDQVAVAAGSLSFPAPTAYRATRAVFDGTTELYMVAPGDLLSYVGSTGDPRVWCPMGDVVTIGPAPSDDRVLLHYWYRQPSWLADDNDQPAIPDQFIGSVVAKAAELLSSREGSTADAARHNNEFNTWIARMRRDVKRGTPPTRVRVRPGGWI